MTALSFSSLIISPMRFADPTLTTSYMLLPSMPFATTSGPAILSIVPITITSSFLSAAIRSMPTALSINFLSVSVCVSLCAVSRY